MKGNISYLFTALLVTSYASAVTVNPGGPVIMSATPLTTSQKQTITIYGSGFGTYNPYNGDSNYLMVSDITQQWSAGMTGNSITLNITSWAANKIVISGFTGGYGQNNVWHLVNGDIVLIVVGNPLLGISGSLLGGSNQPGRGPAVCVVIVGSGLPCIM